MQRPRCLLRLVRAFPSLIVTVVIIFSLENYQKENNKNQKTKIEREDVN